MYFIALFCTEFALIDTMHNNGMTTKIQVWLTGSTVRYTNTHAK